MLLDRLVAEYGLHIFVGPGLPLGLLGLWALGPGKLHYGLWISWRSPPVGPGQKLQ